MIDHVSIAVKDLGRSAGFYDATLGLLGMSRLADRPGTIGYGKRYPEFWLNSRPDMAAIESQTGAHVCLRARSQELVVEFHTTALRHGGSCDGPPGMREATMTNYFGAFVLDPDGNKIEVVTFPTPA